MVNEANIYLVLIMLPYRLVEKFPQQFRRRYRDRHDNDDWRRLEKRRWRQDAPNPQHSRPPNNNSFLLCDTVDFPLKSTRLSLQVNYWCIYISCNFEESVYKLSFVQFRRFLNLRLIWFQFPLQIANGWWFVGGASTTAWKLVEDLFVDILFLLLPLLIRVLISNSYVSETD